MSRDFTHDVWKKICLALINSGYDILTLSKYIALKNDNELPKRYAILRHDIDRRVNSALKMARLEASIGVHATYYFRIPYTFDKSAIQQIAQMGHEVGFHYECLSKSDGDLEKAYEIFAQELGELNSLEGVPAVKTICMHGRPLSPYDNRDMWKSKSFDEYGLLGEAYLSVQDVCYFTDTGRSWEDTNSVRDFLATGREHKQVHSSEEFMQWISETNEKGIYVTSHPERWASSFVDWIRCFGTDTAINAGKKILIRKNKGDNL